MESVIGSKLSEKILDKIYDLLVKMDRRLKVIEDSIKEEEKNKKWYKDTNKQLLQD
jgi:hypothetical protein